MLCRVRFVKAGVAHARRVPLFFLWLGAALSAVLPGIALGAPASAPPAVKIVLWHTQDRFQAAFLRSLCQDFSRMHPGIEVEIEDIVDLPAVLLKGAALGVLPDVVFSPADTVGMRVPLSLSPIPARELNPGIARSTYASVSLDGNVYGEPVLSGNHLVFYYNRSMMPDPPKSWEELERLAATPGPDGKKRAALGGWPVSDPYFFLPFLLTAGGVDVSTARLDIPKTRGALISYKELERTGVAAADCSYLCSTNDFFRGRFAFTINGEWAFEDTRKALGANFGVARLPSWRGRPMVSPRGTFALLFPNNGLARGRAPTLHALTRYFQSPEVQRRYANEARRFAVLKHVAAEQARHPDPAFRTLASLLDESDPIVPSPRILFLWPALQKGLKHFLNGELPIDRATQLMNDTSAAARLAFERLGTGGPTP